MNIYIYIYIHTYVHIQSDERDELEAGGDVTVSALSNNRIFEWDASSASFGKTLNDNRDFEGTNLAVYERKFVNTIHTYQYMTRTGTSKVRILLYMNKNLLILYICFNICLLCTHMHTQNMHIPIIHTHIHTYIHTYIHINMHRLRFPSNLMDGSRLLKKLSDQHQRIRCSGGTRKLYFRTKM